jgi:CheY-like chemotaxis protein
LDLPRGLFNTTRSKGYGRQMGALRGLRVLIAEDDLMIADLVEEVLIEQGYEVCGIARTVGDAVALAKCHKPDLAILDLRLADGGLGTEIAAQLLPFGKLGILYATGNFSQVKLSLADGNACLSKPYRAVDLVRSLEIVSEVIATGTSLPPFPPGFCLLEPAALTPAVST